MAGWSATARCSAPRADDNRLTVRTVAGISDGLGAKVMDWADNLAFCMHDVEDGRTRRPVALTGLTAPEATPGLACQSCTERCRLAELAKLLRALLAQTPFTGLVGPARGPATALKARRRRWSG